MSLRSKLIRLAHAQPELRPKLLPLLETKKAAAAPPWAKPGLRKIDQGFEELFKAMGAHFTGETPSGNMSEGTEEANAIFNLMGDKLGKRLIQFANTDPGDWSDSFTRSLIQAYQEFSRGDYSDY